MPELVRVGELTLAAQQAERGLTATGRLVLVLAQRLEQRDRELAELRDEILAVSNRLDATNRVVRSLSNIHP